MPPFPGIPEPGSFHPVDFQIAFWAALYSGLLYSLVTGLVVGIAVWLVQRGAESRRLTNECKREMAALIERLRPALNREDALNITNATVSKPPSAMAAIQLLAEFPITLWQATLPNARLVQLLRRLKKTDSEFSMTASKLDERLVHIVRKHYSSLHPVNDQPLIMFFVGRINDVAGEDLMPWLNQPSPPRDASALEGEFAEINGDKEIQSLVLQYLRARRQLLEDVSELRCFLAVSETPTPFAL